MKRIDKVGNYIVIKNSRGEEMFNAPSISTIFIKKGSKFKIMSLNKDTRIRNQNVVGPEEDFDVDGDLTDWLRDNTGFNSASGSSDAVVETITGDGVGGTSEDVTITFPTPADIGAITESGVDTKLIDYTPNGGYTGTTQDLDNNKQDNLTAGDNITIVDGVISSESSETLEEILTKGNSANNLTIEDLADPVNEQDAANRRYVDEATADLNMTVQEIDTGGNYNNLEVTGNVLVFKNENAQAILNGLHGKKVIEIHNLSQTQDLRISNMSSSVSGNGKPIKSPIDIVLTGKGGTARLVYNEVEEYYILVDVWASTTRPEFPDVDEDKAIIVNSESNARTMDIVELRVFRDAQTVAMTKEDLNTAYPDAYRGFEVICKDINRSYMKVDNNTNDWTETMNTDVV